MANITSDTVVLIYEPPIPASLWTAITSPHGARSETAVIEVDRWQDIPVASLEPFIPHPEKLFTQCHVRVQKRLRPPPAEDQENKLGREILDGSATELGKRLWRVADSVIETRTTLKGVDKLPERCEVAVRQTENRAHMPNRLLAVRHNIKFAQGWPPKVVENIIKYTALPVHDVVLRRLGIIPVPDPLKGSAEGDRTLSLPFQEYWTSHPGSMAYIIELAYTGDIRRFFAQIITHEYSARQNRTAILDPRVLIRDYSLGEVIKQLQFIEGTCQNLCDLRIQDGRIWDALNVLWRIMVTSFAAKTQESGNWKTLLTDCEWARRFSDCAAEPSGYLMDYSYLW